MLLPMLKYWICVLFLFSFFFFITIYYTLNSVFVQKHLVPHTVYVKINPNLSSNWNTKKLRQIYNSSVSFIEPNHVSNNITNFCPEIPPGLQGKVLLKEEPVPSFSALLKEFENSSLQLDGRYQPKDCVSRYQIAIIVPYRDRFKHLNIFLRNIHPFLQKQQLDYTIFIIEQAGNGLFNRGMLMNIGFVEAMKIRFFDCFIFHDVDLLPEDDRNIYNCPKQPRHMSVAVDVFRYKLPYSDIFGGISAISAEHFQLINGFSNMFWGWGGEDDDMLMRIKMKGLHLARYPFNIARYTMLPHEKQKADPFRFEKLYLGRKRFQTEGLNSLEYQRIALRRCKLFTWIYVELTPHIQENPFINIIRNSYFYKLFKG